MVAAEILTALISWEKLSDLFIAIACGEAGIPVHELI